MSAARLPKMKVLVAGAHGRLGSRVVALLLGRGHAVRALVRAEAQADGLREVGADAVVGDLRGDLEWAAEGCEAAIFAAGARHRRRARAIDAAAPRSSPKPRTATSTRASSSAASSGRIAPSAGGRHARVPGGQASRRAAAGRPRPALVDPSLRPLHRSTGDGRMAPGPPVRHSCSAATMPPWRSRTRSMRPPRPAGGHLVDGERAVADALDSMPPVPLPRRPRPRRARRRRSTRRSRTTRPTRPT